MLKALLLAFSGLFGSAVMLVVVLCSHIDKNFC